jgi:hypothetical protein
MPQEHAILMGVHNDVHALRTFSNPELQASARAYFSRRVPSPIFLARSERARA